MSPHSACPSKIATATDGHLVVKRKATRKHNLPNFKRNSTRRLVVLVFLRLLSLHQTLQEQYRCSEFAPVCKRGSCPYTFFRCSPSKMTTLADKQLTVEKEGNFQPKLPKIQAEFYEALHVLSCQNAHIITFAKPGNADHSLGANYTCAASVPRLPHLPIHEGDGATSLWVRQYPTVGASHLSC
jgi:hypothetical protein